MASPDLHKFEQDLKNRPAKGSDAPPRTLRAKDLDDNFSKITVIETGDDPPPYEVEYTKDGTKLKNIRGLPKNAIAKEFFVCEFGQPRSYWFIVWEDEPQLPENI